jgi:hypothetical protein
MSLVSMLKKAGKALRLDYAKSAVEASVRLRGFASRFGVEVDFFPKGRAGSDLPIDVVIPVVDKDADTLPFVVESVREFIRHPVKDIYFICPGSSIATRRIAAEKGCVFIDERDLVPIAPKDISYVWQGHDRSGWVYQQFLKWSGGAFCSQKHYLVADSDTVFARPQSFERDGKIFFDFCDEYHAPYFRAFERILGIEPRSNLSFTSHHALIDTIIMKQLVSDIEARNGMPWYRAIVAAIDQDEMSCVSDYENYAQYVLEKRPSLMVARYWYNKSLPRREIADLEGVKRIYGSLYSTISFHSYK